MSDLENIIRNIENIEKWIDSSPNLPDFVDNDDFMKFSVEMMNRCLYLLKLGVALVPNEEASQKGYTKHRAIIVGHMVRTTKLYEGVLVHISNRQLELAMVFIRLIFETTIKLEYLLQSKTKPRSSRSFILASYKPEKEMLKDLIQKSKQRSLIPIEKRIKRNIITSMKKDRISQKELMNNRKWNVDGRDFRSLLAILNKDMMYSYVFGNGSHYVHGDWHEIRAYHIQHQGRHYFPELKFTDPDPRVSCPITAVCLNTLMRYLDWNHSDPDGFVSPVIEKMMNLNRELDAAHEQTLGS